jgi:hypothetical protein
MRPGNDRFRAIPIFLWKPYTGQKFFGFLPMISGRFGPENTGSLQESIRKNLSNFWPKYCFHVSAISGGFLKDTVNFPHLSCRVLRDPVAGIFDLGGVDHLVMINIASHIKLNGDKSDV